MRSDCLWLQELLQDCFAAQQTKWVVVGECRYRCAASLATAQQAATVVA
jgi:hypothetical protein